MTDRTAAERGVFLASLLVLLLPAGALAAGDRGFQIELSGVLSKPIGTYSTGEKAGDLLDLGGRLSTKLMFGIGRGSYIGAWVAYLKNQKDFASTSILDTRPPIDIQGTRTLTSIPVEALFQIRNDTRHRVSGYVEGGAGITTYTWRLSELTQEITPDSSITLAPDSDVQQTFSFHFGAGAVLELNRDWEVVAGLAYHQSIVRGGEVWNTDDDPKYALLSLGVRYPRW